MVLKKTRVVVSFVANSVQKDKVDHVNVAFDVVGDCSNNNNTAHLSDELVGQSC